MYGLNIDPRNPKGNPSAKELYELGVEIVRYTYADSSSGDQPGSDQLQFYKKLVRELKEVGIDSLLILNYETYPNKPDPNAGDGEWDAYIDRLARRCGQIARELAQWKPAFQIWNEPDHPIHPGYAPTVREAIFGRMMRKCFDAIKAVNPGLSVIAGGLATGDHTWLQRVVQSVGGNLPADAIAFHPYGQRPEHNWPRPDWFFGYVGNLLNNYYQAGGGKPIWITEMGVKEQDIDNDRNKAAEFIRRYYNTMNTYFSNRVHHLIWFCYSDGMVPTFGLTDAAGNRKPAYDVFKQITPRRQPLQPVVPIVTQPSVGISTTPLPPAPVISPPASIPGITVTPIAPATTIPLTGQPTDINVLLQQAAEWNARVQELQAELTEFQQMLQQFIVQQGQPAMGSAGTVGLVTPSAPVQPAVTGRPAPPIQNITNQLKHAPDKQFPVRPLNQIQRVVIHHTATPPTVGAERIAAHRVDSQGWPGIGYHYFITGEGAIQQTNELTTQSTHAGQYDPVAIGVCFAGDFTSVVPSPAQIAAGAQLIAWLMRQFGLPLNAVNGYKELVVTQSPGQQWDNGAMWGNQLKQQIQAYL
jgi:hypothetical protein